MIFKKKIDFLDELGLLIGEKQIFTKKKQSVALASNNFVQRRRKGHNFFSIQSTDFSFSGITNLKRKNLSASRCSHRKNNLLE
jgi:hypothetical protein